MDKFLLFTTGGGSADPLNWTNDEAALYPVSQFKGMRPASSRTIDMFFETSFGKEVVLCIIRVNNPNQFLFVYNWNSKFTFGVNQSFYMFLMPVNVI